MSLMILDKISKFDIFTKNISVEMFLDTFRSEAKLQSNDLAV